MGSIATWTVPITRRSWMTRPFIARRLPSLASLMLATASGCATARLPSDSLGNGTVVITNVTVISMRDSVARHAQTVVIRDGRISEIGSFARTRVPPDATVVDGAGKFLIPGLIEMHTHTSKTRASALGLFVAYGVTTLRDMGSEPAEVIRWRNEINAATRVGPRMIIAGPYLESLRNIQRMRKDPPESRIEPFERARIPIASPEEARRVVDSLAALGVDFFKMRTVQDGATYLALGNAARARGKRLVGHVVTASAERFLEGAQAGVEHGFPPTLDSLPREQRMEFWRALAARGVGVVPTLVVTTESVARPLAYYKALLTDTAAKVHPLGDYLSAFLVQDWREQVEELTPQRRAYFDRLWPIALKHVREMRESGVRVMAGSDVAVLGIFPGATLHEELRLFVDSVGMTPYEALSSATRVPAEWLGLGDAVGTIEAGKVADLVLLDADPLADIANTRRISAVVLRGRTFLRADLVALLAAANAMPDQRAIDWLR